MFIDTANSCLFFLAFTHPDLARMIRGGGIAHSFRTGIGTFFAKMLIAGENWGLVDFSHSLFHPFFFRYAITILLHKLHWFSFSHKFPLPPSLFFVGYDGCYGLFGLFLSFIIV